MGLFTDTVYRRFSPVVRRRSTGGSAISEPTESVTSEVEPPAVRPPVRLQYLDVLRGFAILLVMLRHAWPNTFPGAGIVGVALFFGLSGYLITGLVDRDLNRFGRPRFARFYLHRIFRLYPALLLLVIVATIIQVGILKSPPSLTHALPTIASAVFYLSDIPHFFIHLFPLSHLWTLAIEEQFYLVWPVLLWLLFFVTKKLGRVALVVAILLTAICITTVAFTIHPANIYQFATTWASVIAIGGCGYFYRDRIRAVLSRAGWWPAALAVIVLLAASFFQNAKNLSITYIVGPTLIGLCALVLIEWATRESHSVVRFPLVKPLRWLGVVSYAAYLWNLPITTWWDEKFSWLPAWTQVTVLPLTVIAAIVSWFTAEAVGRALRRRFDLWTAARAAASSTQ